MKKLLIICIVLTACTLAMWWLSSGHADIYSPAQTKEPALDAEKELALATTVEPDIQLSPPPHTTEDDSFPQAQSSGPGWATEPKQRETPPLLALTFDDGPSAENTPILLDGLRERGVRVTFFVMGVLAEKMPEIVLQAYNDGHVIGGHSYDHSSSFTKLNAAALKTQLQKTEDIIANITGEKPPFLLRPPNGRINEEVAKITGKANILWDIDPRDWAVRDAEIVRATIMEQAVDGGVVILHDIHDTSVEGALMVIDELLAEGWQLVTIPELYAAYGIPLQAGGIYRSPLNYID